VCEQVRCCVSQTYCDVHFLHFAQTVQCGHSSETKLVWSRNCQISQTHYHQVTLHFTSFKMSTALDLTFKYATKRTLSPTNRHAASSGDTSPIQKTAPYEQVFAKPIRRFTLFRRFIWFFQGHAKVDQNLMMFALKFSSSCMLTVNMNKEAHPKNV